MAQCVKCQTKRVLDAARLDPQKQEVFAIAAIPGNVSMAIWDIMQKRNKYGNTIVYYDNIRFSSKKEMQRFIVLRQAEKDGLISDLKRQVTYELIPKLTEQVVQHLKTKDKVVERVAQRPITYTCDFEYIKDGVKVVEDCKISPKMLPPEYILREKLFRWKFGFGIRRVYKANEEV